MAHSLSGFRTHAESLPENPPPEESIGDCGQCVRPVFPKEAHRDERGRVELFEGDRPIHSGCYYDKLSDVIDRHPPGLPGIRR